jgi:hypothetical protein
MSNPMQEALSDILEGRESISPFASEAESEGEQETEQKKDIESEQDEEDDQSTEVEGEDEGEDDGSDNDSDDEDDDTDDDDGGEKSKTVPLAALHAERARRKGVAEQLTQVQQALNAATQESAGYKDAFDTLVQQLRSAGLEDQVDIKKPVEETAEVKQLRQQQQERMATEQRQQVFSEIHETVMDALPEYTSINSSNEQQGEALMQMIIADMVMNGKSVDDAVHDSMSTLNALVTATKKAASRKTVTPGKQLQKGGAGSRKAATKPKRGSVDFFKTLGNNMFGE